MSKTTISSLTDRIAVVLEALIEKEVMFTLLDVSNAVKQDGGGFIRHRDCRQIAQKLMKDEEVDGSDDYVRSDISVSTNQGQNTAHLYHLIDDDPEDYSARSQTALTPRDINASVAGTQPVMATTGSRPIFTGAPTKVGKSTLSNQTRHQNMVTNSRASKIIKPRSYDGAIEIPVKVLRAAELFDTMIVITFHPNSISISKASGHEDNIRHSYYGMRISADLLGKSDLAGEDAYTVVAFNDRIVIDAL